MGTNDEKPNRIIWNHDAGEKFAIWSDYADSYGRRIGARYTIEPGVVEAAPETYLGYRVDRPVGPIWRVTFSATREGRGDYGASNRPHIFTSRADADAFGKSYFLDVHKRAAKVRKAQRVAP